MAHTVGNVTFVQRPVHPFPDPLAEPLQRLAREVRYRSQCEERQRKVHEPLPLPVRWRVAAVTEKYAPA
ncbi:hypothetical protein, partial [Saccharopolyspora spinosa]